MSEIATASNPADLEQLNIAIIGVDGARRDAARDAGDARLSAETQAAGGFRGFVRRIWKGNYANQYYRQKYYNQALGKIDTSGNIYANEEGMSDSDAMAATVSRFTHESADELIHHGERRYEIDDDPEEPVRKSVLNLISSYAKDELDDNSFEEEKNRVLKELAGSNKEKFGEGQMFADNMLEIAQNVKAAVRHGKGLDEILASAKIITGEARMGVRSEAKYNKIDRIVEKIHSTKIGSFFNEATLSTAAAIVAGVSKFGAQKTVAAAATVTGVVGISGGIMASYRESKRFKEERGEHLRERAMGKDFDSSAKRRGRLELTRYTTKSAGDLTAGLNDLIGETGRANVSDAAEYINAVKKVAEARVRIGMSDKMNIDLVHYSSNDKVDSERLNLDLALARARVGIRKALQEGGSDLLPAGLKTSTFDQLLESYEKTFTSGQVEEINDKDAIFSKMRHVQMAKAGAIGTLIGFTAATATQEVMAHLPGIGDHTYGLGEHISAKDMAQPHHSTLLHGIFQGKDTQTFNGTSDQLQQIAMSNKANMALPAGFAAHQVANNPSHWQITSPNGRPFSDVLLNKDGSISGESSKHLAGLGFPVHETVVNHALSGQTQELSIGHDKFLIPKEYSASEVSAGHWQVFDAQHHAVSTFDVGPDGRLTADSVAALNHAGITTNATEFTQTVAGQPTTTNVDPSTLVWNHGAETAQVHRTLWYGNDTPGRYDLNEIRTHAGGTNGGWFDSNGNVVVDITKMTHNGSFQSGNSADPFALAANGHLQLAISASKNTQGNTFNFAFHTDANGHTIATIPPGSPVYQLFHEGNGYSGHGEFSGRYIEIMEMTGKNDQIGQQVHILGTYVGTNNQNGLVDTVQHLDTITNRTTTLGFKGPSETIQNFSLNGAHIAETGGDILPVFTPQLHSRAGLENPVDDKNGRFRNPNLIGDYYGGRSLVELQHWLQENPGKLNPRHELVQADGSKVWLEADDTPVERKVERERGVLSRYIEQERSRNPDHMRLVDRVADALPPMADACRVTVNVPAWMEERSLGTMLSEYMAQVNADGTDLNPDLYEVNVLINRKTGSPADNSVGVINNFISDFESAKGFKPKVNFYDIEIDPPFNNVGYARKLLTDAIVERSLRRGGQDRPLYIETEDADLTSVDKRVVLNVIDKMDANPQLDAVRGVQDRTPAIMKQNDYLFIRRRAADFYEILARNKKYRDPLNPNWNFTWNRVVTGGWNTAYSAEVYGLIGGYDSVVAGEDMSVGEKITMIRGDGRVPNLEVVGKVASRNNSSPRRFIEEIKEDFPAYADFANEATNEAIRNTTTDQALDSIKSFAKINDQNQKAFSDYLSFMHTSWSRSTTPTEEEAIKLTQRLFFWLGLKKDDYQINEDGVTFSSFDNLKRALANYRVRYA